MVDIQDKTMPEPWATAISRNGAGDGNEIPKGRAMVSQAARECRREFPKESQAEVRARPLPERASGSPNEQEPKGQR